MTLNRRKLTGPAHPAYRTGKTRDGFGYVQLSSKEHGAQHGRREHQVVAEQMLGRALLPTEVVHHLNHDKADNRPENLVVVARRDHQRLHLGRGKLIACRSCGAEKWHSPSAASRLGRKGYACRPCGGRWA